MQDWLHLVWKWPHTKGVKYCVSKLQNSKETAAFLPMSLWNTSCENRLRQTLERDTTHALTRCRPSHGPQGAHAAPHCGRKLGHSPAIWTQFELNWVLDCPGLLCELQNPFRARFENVLLATKAIKLDYRVQKLDWMVKYKYFLFKYYCSFDS